MKTVYTFHQEGNQLRVRPIAQLSKPTQKRYAIRHPEATHVVMSANVIYALCDSEEAAAQSLNDLNNLK